MTSTELVLFDSRDLNSQRGGGSDSGRKNKSQGKGKGSNKSRKRKRESKSSKKKKQKQKPKKKTKRIRERERVWEYESSSSSDSDSYNDSSSDDDSGTDGEDEDERELLEEAGKVSADVARENDKLLRSFAIRERAPFTGEFGDNRFNPLDMSRIEEAYAMLETEPTMGIAFDFNVDSMIGGGIEFTQSGRRMKDGARDWNQDTYGKLLKDVLQAGWCAGFVPWLIMPDHKYSGKPVVFNMRLNCVVMHYKNYFSEDMFVYIDKTTRHVEFSGMGIEFGGSHSKVGSKYSFLLGGTVIPCIHTEVWSSPNRAGSITSKVQRLLAENIYLSVLRSCSTRAATRRSVPVTITEEGDLRRTQETSNNSRGDLDRKSDRKGENMQRYHDQATSAIALALRTRNAAGGLDNDTYKMLVQEVTAMIEAKMNSSLGPRVDLEHDRRYVAVQLPEEPEHFRDFVVLQMQRIMVSFGLPATLMDPKGRVTVDKSSQESWEMNRQALKLKLLKVMRKAYDSIHHDSHLLDYLQSLPENSDPSEDEAREATRVEITLLGIPAADIMEKMYTMGILDYDKGFRPYLAEHHALPIDWLKETPDLSVQDLLTGGKGELEERKMQQADQHLNKQFKHDESMAKQAQDAALKAKKVDGGKKPPKKKAKTK